MRRSDLVNANVTRLDIDGEFDGLGHVPIAEVRLTLAGLCVQFLGLWRHITSKPNSRPFAFGPGFGRYLGGGHDRVSGHEGQPTRRRRTRITSVRRVTEVSFDVVERDTGRFGSHLQECLMGALADFGTRVV